MKKKCKAFVDEFSSGIKKIFLDILLLILYIEVQSVPIYKSKASVLPIYRARVKLRWPKAFRLFEDVV